MFDRFAGPRKESGPKAWHIALCNHEDKQRGVAVILPMRLASQGRSGTKPANKPYACCTLHRWTRFRSGPRSRRTGGCLVECRRPLARRRVRVFRDAAHDSYAAPYDTPSSTHAGSGLSSYP